MAAIPRKVAWVFRAVFVVVAAGLLLLGTTPSLHGQTLGDDSQRRTRGAAANSGGLFIAAVVKLPLFRRRRGRRSPFGELKTDLFSLWSDSGRHGRIVANLVAAFPLDDNYAFCRFPSIPLRRHDQPSRDLPVCGPLRRGLRRCLRQPRSAQRASTYSTASRFEFDARFQYLGERLADGEQDQLWMGDFNVTYRFAQSERSAVPCRPGNQLDERPHPDRPGLQLHVRRRYVSRKTVGLIGGAGRRDAWPRRALPLPNDHRRDLPVVESIPVTSTPTSAACIGTG